MERSKPAIRLKERTGGSPLPGGGARIRRESKKEPSVGEPKNITKVNVVALADLSGIALRQLATPCATMWCSRSACHHVVDLPFRVHFSGDEGATLQVGSLVRRQLSTAPRLG